MPPADHTATADSSRPTSRRKEPAGEISERLAGLRPKSPPVLPPLVSPRRLTKEEQERHVQTVYTTAVEKRRKQTAANEALQQSKIESERSVKVLKTKDEILETVQRLNDEAIAHRKAEMTDLVRRYIKTIDHSNRTRTTSPTPRDGRPLAPSELQDCVQRMYREGMKRQKEAVAALVNEYCPERKSPRLTAEQVKASADRLSKTSK